jgi:beta-lactamase superfamily II metal-dependent hydrolase
LKKLNLPKIDAIFLSHGHGDHVDGLEPICKTFKVDNVFISDYKEM